MPRVRRYERPGDFLEAARPFLMRDEARHNLELGICGRLVADPLGFGDTDPYLAATTIGGDVIGVAIRTPPFDALVSTSDPGAMDTLAQDIRERFPSLSGVLSDSPTAAAFAARWHALTGQRPVEGMPQRIYQLAVPPEVPIVGGSLREAHARDRDLLLGWVEEFSVEALSGLPRPDATEVVDGRLGHPSRGLVLWEDGVPVSLAGFGSPTPNGIRIGPVYTPPALRGRGYATACVGTLSQRLLGEGYRFLFLFTDLRNPLSNRLYVKLGYEPVCDMQEITFGEPLAG